MLEYSQEGLSARPAFYAPYNDITIIVEDAGKENFYTQVMNRLFQGNLRITQVLGVGGKRQVLARLAERPERREFYLVDGDFDDVLGRKPPDSIYFYRLRRYDIESYLVEESAICTIAEEEFPRRKVFEFQILLGVVPWIADVIDLSFRLVTCFALLQELEETQTGIPQSIEHYVTENSIFPDSSAIDAQIARVRDSLSVVESQEFDHSLERMAERMGASNFERTRWISGKDILIPLLIRLLRQHTKRSFKKESLCFRLARNCEFPELAELRDRILAVA